MGQSIETYDFLPDQIKVEKPQIAKKTVEAMKLVIENGLSPRNALILATGNPNPHRNTVQNFKAKCAKWSIERPAAQKIAHSALLKFASGKDVNGIVPKAVDVRAAAERIIDQTTPVIKRTENLNINADVCPVDLGKYNLSGQ